MPCPRPPFPRRRRPVPRSRAGSSVARLREKKLPLSGALRLILHRLGPLNQSHPGNALMSPPERGVLPRSSCSESVPQVLDQDPVGSSSRILLRSCPPSGSSLLPFHVKPDFERWPYRRLACRRRCHQTGTPAMDSRSRSRERS
ncbi:hypothetical protein ACFFX0_17115 [Citricoccus parietis]|uniref:Uncharacterized protein n=1 Tax=Citricoccus parietis TaxID=592307 RepID=A0ABV5G1N8_9MICC